MEETAIPMLAVGESEKVEGQQQTEKSKQYIATIAGNFLHHFHTFVFSAFMLQLLQSFANWVINSSSQYADRFILVPI